MHKRQHKKIFWGILFLLGAAALLIGGLGHLEGFSFWTILFSIALLGCLVDGILDRSFGQILFSLAIFIIINDDFLHLEAITPLARTGRRPAWNARAEYHLSETLRMQNPAASPSP